MNGVRIGRFHVIFALVVDIPLFFVALVKTVPSNSDKVVG